MTDRKNAPDITKQQLINTHMVPCVNRIPPEQKQFPEVLYVFRKTPEQKADSLREIPFFAEFRIPLEQLSPEHPPPMSIRTPQEEPHFVVLST
jgi:hypothetical protein